MCLTFYPFHVSIPLPLREPREFPPYNSSLQELRKVMMETVHDQILISCSGLTQLDKTSGG